MKSTKGTETPLEVFNSDFQYAAVRAMVLDPTFLATYNKTIEPAMFPDENLRLIVATAVDYYRKLGYRPGWMELRYKCDQACHDETRKMYIDEMIDKLKNEVTESETEFAKREFESFIKWMTMVRNCRYALEQLRDYRDHKTYQQICKSFNDVLKLEDDNAIVTKMSKEFIVEVMTATNDNIIPTYIPGMDERIGGGLEKGGIGYFLAPTGYGKTTFSSILAFNEAVHGHKVLQIYFEDDYKDLGRKHVAMLYKNYINKFKNITEECARNIVDERTDEVVLQALEDNLRMARMIDRGTTVEDIEERMNRIASEEGWRPDVIIIDYFSCLKTSRNPIKDKTQAEADCMRKIKALALQYDISVWVMQQTNRTGAKGEEKGSMGNVQGAYEATQPVSLWLELARTREQKQNNRADIIIVKCRHANGDPVFEDIVFNNGLLKIDCTDSGASFDEDLDYHEDAEPPVKGDFKLHGGA